MQKRTFGRHLDLADVSIQPDFPTGTHHCLLPSCSAPLSPWVVCSPPSQAEAPGGQEWLFVHLHCAPVACSPNSSFCLTITWEDRGEERHILSFHRRGDRGPDVRAQHQGDRSALAPGLCLTQMLLPSQPHSVLSCSPCLRVSRGGC